MKVALNKEKSSKIDTMKWKITLFQKRDNTLYAHFPSDFTWFQILFQSQMSREEIGTFEGLFFFSTGLLIL